MLEDLLFKQLCDIIQTCPLVLVSYSPEYVLSIIYSMPSFTAENFYYRVLEGRIKEQADILIKVPTHFICGFKMSPPYFPPDT